MAGKSPRKSAAKKPAGKTLKEKRSAKKLKSSDRRHSPDRSAPLTPPPTRVLSTWDTIRWSSLAAGIPGSTGG